MIVSMDWCAIICFGHHDDLYWLDLGRPVLRPPVVGRCGKLDLDRCRTWVAGNCVTKGCKRSLVTSGLFNGSRSKHKRRKSWPCGDKDSGNGGTVSTQAIWYMAVTGVLYWDQGGRPVAISIIVQPTLRRRLASSLYRSVVL